MVRRNMIFLICLFAALCYAIPAQENKPAESKTATAAQDSGSDLVVARVSGEPITEKQVVSVIEQIARQSPMLPDQRKQRNTLLFKDAVDNLTAIALLKSQAEQLNLTVDKAKLDQQIQNISKQFPSQEAFQKAMASQGVTESELRKNVEESMTLQLVIDQATRDAPTATDAEVQKFYDDNSEKFPTPEQLHAAHILLRVDPKSTPEQKAEIKKRLEGIRADIEANKITFSDAAAQYSQDPSNAKNGGDLGFFQKGKMVKPFEDAAFATQPGTLSQVVETQFGFHIIKVIELKPAGKATFEQARGTIKQYLDQLNRQKVAQKYLEGLKAKATVETFMTPEEFGKRHPVD
jgi:peptidyl-prolyl cis-trans isomerase C